MSNEDWETGSGFNLDGATGTIVEAEFGYNAKIGAGVTCANFTIDPGDGEEPIEQSFSVGGNFEANRDGSELEGEGKINKNSNFGILIESVKGVVTEEELEDIGSPRVAANWIGLSFDWGSIERETMNPTTQAKKMSTKFIVTAYHGRVAEEKKGKGEKKGAAKKGAAKKDADNGVDPDLWQKLVALANEHEDHGDFVNAALDMDEVSGDRAVQKLVMGTKAGTVWAEAKG